MINWRRIKDVYPTGQGHNPPRRTQDNSFLPRHSYLVAGDTIFNQWHIKVN
ncbi:MAG: hypothetical protein KJ666_14895 [Bacteroidetes bacterium]|nr:hypothetical protein [Bacteroidota bacterium]